MKKIILMFVVFLSIIHIAKADQGTCGTNCYYELDDKGFMLIKPLNASEKAYIQDEAFAERKDFTKVIINEGILSIGNSAFYDTNLVKIELPNTLIDIGYNAFFETKLTKIMYATFSDNPEIINTLINAGANVNARDNEGVTPLMLASMVTSFLKKSPEAINALINAGADVNTKNNKGYTPLMYAIFSDNPEIIKTLINVGADVNAKTKESLPPLMFAAGYSEKSEIVQALVDAGADVNAYTEDPLQTATLISLSNPNHKIFEILVQSDIDKFCRMNRSYSEDIYYCKDRLTNYMQKEHLLPSCINNVAAMIGLSPVIQAMQSPDHGKGTYAFVALAEMTSQLNCSIYNTFKDLGIVEPLVNQREQAIKERNELMNNLYNEFNNRN